MIESALSRDLAPPDPRSTSRDRRSLLRASLLSAVFHGVLLALLIGLWRTAPELDVAPVIPVTLAGLEGIAGASGNGSGDTAAGGASADATDQSSPSAPAAEAAPAPPPPPPEAKPPETAQAETPAPPAITAPLASQAETRRQTKPRKPPPKPQVARVEPEPRPQPKPSAPPAPPQQTAAAEPASSANAASGATPAEGVGGSGRAAQGIGRAAAGNGAREGPGDDYLELVRRWVTRFRKYPEEAVKQKQEGTVAIGFKFTRDGTVIDAWIEKSSGYPLLDAAALKMMHDASPIPKVPDKYQGETLTLVMPENFRIGIFDRLFH